jgi:hypothetical protein
LIVIKVDFGIAVTVNTPAHAQLGELFYLIHFRDIAMTSLALYFTGFCML